MSASKPEAKAGTLKPITDRRFLADDTRGEVGMLPKSGRAWNEIKNEMISFKKGDCDWRRGRLPSYIYYRDEELLSVQKEAYSLYFVENALGKHKAFPSLLKMESDVIKMALGFLGGNEGSDGVFTSGGTESILLAVKSAREWARAEGRFVEPFKVMIPETAHPAFNRAGELLGVNVIRLPTRAHDFVADVNAFTAALDKHTIMLVGSAPQYPNGVIDPIEELGALALERKLWLHVDACVGGFLAPFVRMNGAKLPNFDLSVPGVRSLSADTHKYGFAAKGASLLLFRRREDRPHAGFVLNWMKGTYTTDTMQGTRAGGAVACAWAVMNYLGEEGYRANARIIMDTVQAFTNGIDAIPGLRVIRPFDLCLFSYCSNEPGVEINAVGDVMVSKGWFVGRNLKPVPSLQLAINPVHAPIVAEYLTDLRDSVAQVRSKKLTGTFDTRSY